jgi:hypothetical protein
MSCVYADIGTIMYAHKSTIVPTHICTLRCDRAHAFYTHSLSCPRVYAHIGVIMPRLPMRQHGVCKDLPDCHHEHPSLVAIVICMHDGWMVEEYDERVG